jgi:hypothetical protein
VEEVVIVFIETRIFVVIVLLLNHGHVLIIYTYSNAHQHDQHHRPAINTSRMFSTHLNYKAIEFPVKPRIT